MFPKGRIVSASWVLTEFSCNGPRRCSWDWMPLCFPVLIQALGVFLPHGCPLAGSGHFPYMFGQLAGEKRAKRKHFCFLKAMANIPVARPRPLISRGCQGCWEMQFLAGQPLSSASSSAWDREHGLSGQLAISALPLVRVARWLRSHHFSEDDGNWSPPQVSTSLRSRDWCL